MPTPGLRQRERQRRDGEPEPLGARCSRPRDRRSGGSTGTAILSRHRVRSWTNTLLSRPQGGDAWVAAGVGTGYTYDAATPHARIDYVLTSEGVVARTAAVVTTDSSDHLPVVVDLDVPPAP